MTGQALNPILPVNEYIADGEPHVFGNRVYIFGSHDKGDGKTYCMLDYVFYSAPVDDLTNWTTKGVSYSAKQDPLYGDKIKYLYAPDVVQGNDGRFYLYYCMSGEKGQGGYRQHISVAVCDTPDGKYEYYGYVKNPDGSPMKKYVAFDPSVINDNGIIRLYYGAWYPFREFGRILNPIFDIIESNLFGKSVSEIKTYVDGVSGANHVELSSDMLTVKSEPVHIIPSRVKGTSFEKHPFFEAGSIRKTGNTYYFIYSSLKGHELCYATSIYPDRDFTYRGTIVSNGDVGYKGRKGRDRLNTTGTNHGSIECLNGKWYVFYHRNTNKTSYSRQACAEPIEILSDGMIPQVEITTQGLNDKPLSASGIYPASVCCNLTNGKMPHCGNGIIKRHIPFISAKDEQQTVVAINGTCITYKYFYFPFEPISLKILFRTSGNGKLLVKTSEQSTPLAEIDLSKSTNWQEKSFTCQFPSGRQKLIFLYQGKGELELAQFSLAETK